MLHVVRSLQSLELQMLSIEHEKLPIGEAREGLQPFFDIVNTIRENESVFSEWHASATVELYTPTVFSNNNISGGYWFYKNVKFNTPYFIIKKKLLIFANY